MIIHTPRPTRSPKAMAGVLPRTSQPHLPGVGRRYSPRKPKLLESAPAQLISIVVSFNREDIKGYGESNRFKTQNSRNRNGNGMGICMSDCLAACLSVCMDDRMYVWMYV